MPRLSLSWGITEIGEAEALYKAEIFIERESVRDRDQYRDKMKISIIESDKASKRPGYWDVEEKYLETEI